MGKKLSETPIKLEKFQYSSSKRKALAQCHLKYYHQFVAKTYPFTETPAILIGNHCDEVLEKAIFSGENPDLDKLEADIHNIDPHYKYLDSLVEGIDAAHEYALSRTGLKIQQHRMALDKVLQPTRVNWAKNSRLFDSAMPDLWTVNDTKLYIDDWKSGNPNYPDRSQLMDYGLYGYLFIPGLREIEASFIWTRKGRHPKDIVHKTTMNIKTSDIKGIVDRWAKAHEIVVKNNVHQEWLPSTSPLCTYCDHYDNCEAHDDGYR